MIEVTPDVCPAFIAWGQEECGYVIYIGFVFILAYVAFRKGS
jgi:hypothetical protein